MKLIASVLHLDRKAVQALKINDAYGLHKAVYSLFPDVRSAAEKQASKPSGFLYADQGGNYKSRKILLLSDREPMAQIDSQYGEVQSKIISPDFLQHEAYRFKVVINPTRRDSASRKLVPVKGRDAIAQWLIERAPASWGFSVVPSQLQVDGTDVLSFKDKAQRQITLAQAQIQGRLQVTDRQQFMQSFSQGIGRGRAFGCGLLQLVPFVENPFD